MYASIQDLREEGVTHAQATDERLLGLLKEATLAIDRYTGWFFAPQEMALRLEGRGAPSLEPPVPPIRLDELAVGAFTFSTEPQDVVVLGAPVGPNFVAPRISRTEGYVFPRTTIVASGLWGYTEPDGTPEGRTPLEIRRACMLMAMRWLSPLAHGDNEARQRWRIIEERTRDQSYKLDTRSAAPVLTGDPDIDDILLRYRKPAPLGAI